MKGNSQVPSHALFPAYRCDKFRIRFAQRRLRGRGYKVMAGETPANPASLERKGLGVGLSSSQRFAYLVEEAEQLFVRLQECRFVICDPSLCAELLDDRLRLLHVDAR